MLLPIVKGKMVCPPFHIDKLVGPAAESFVKTNKMIMSVTTAKTAG